MLSAGLHRGLRMQDAEVMTVGMWMDYVIECYNAEQKQREELEEERKHPGKRKAAQGKRRKATQADFDTF